MLNSRWEIANPKVQTQVTSSCQFLVQIPRSPLVGEFTSYVIRSRLFLNLWHDYVRPFLKFH